MAVSYQKEKKCWRAYVFYQRKQYLVGTFKSKVHAEVAFLMWKDFFDEKKKKACKLCGQSFLPIRSDQIYCGSWTQQMGCSINRSPRLNNPEYYRRKAVLDYQRHSERYAKNGRAYRARKYGAEGSHTEQEWEAVKAKYLYQCVMCKRSDKPLTRDHIIPLSKQGSDYIQNIQPLCKNCNCSKRDRLLEPT